MRYSALLLSLLFGLYSFDLAVFIMNAKIVCRFNAQSQKKQQLKPCPNSENPLSFFCKYITFYLHVKSIWDSCKKKQPTHTQKAGTPHKCKWNSNSNKTIAVMTKMHKREKQKIQISTHIKAYAWNEANWRFSCWNECDYMEFHVAKIILHLYSQTVKYIIRRLKSAFFSRSQLLTIYYYLSFCLNETPPFFMDTSRNTVAKQK